MCLIEPALLVFVSQSIRTTTTSDSLFSLLPSASPSPAPRRRSPNLLIIVYVIAPIAVIVILLVVFRRKLTLWRLQRKLTKPAVVPPRAVVSVYALHSCVMYCLLCLCCYYVVV